MPTCEPSLRELVSSLLQQLQEQTAAIQVDEPVGRTVVPLPEQAPFVEQQLVQTELVQMKLGQTKLASHSRSHEASGRAV